MGEAVPSEKVNGPSEEAVADRIADAIACADSDLKWAFQFCLASLSALVGLALIPFYLSALDVALYLVFLLIAIPYSWFLWRRRRFNWVAYFGGSVDAT